MALSFKNVQDELIPRRFPTSMLTTVKRWINEEGAAIWNSQHWTFRQAKASVTVTSGSSTITALPADLGAVQLLQRYDGSKLVYLEPYEFNRIYFGDSSTGTPAHYTNLNGVLSVGPTSGETSSTYQLLYEKRWTQLVADADVPAFPDDCQAVLVHAAGCAGRNELSDFTYQFHAEQRDRLVAAMLRQYLIASEDGVVQWGADPVGRTGW